MQLPLISVIMASFNQGRFIREAIESVLSQKGCRVELIVLDGGSTDETLDILRSYGDRFTWTSGPDDGQSAAINEGFDRASGDIYCWLNTDDAFTEGALAHVTELFLAHPDVAWLYGRGHNMAEDGTIIGFAGVREFDTWELIHHRNFINQPSTFWRASLWDVAGGLDVDLHYVMDWELWIRFAAYPRLFTPRSLSHNRVYADNKTQSGRYDRWEEIRRMVETHGFLPDPPVLDLYRLEAEIQELRAQESPESDIEPLSKRFLEGMIDRRYTGRESNGALRPEFHMSIPGNADGAVSLVVEPLSRFVASRLGGAAVQFQWQSSLGATGRFDLAETGVAQTWSVPVAAPVGQLEHFRFECLDPGVELPGDGAVVGYLLGTSPSHRQSHHLV